GLHARHLKIACSEYYPATPHIREQWGHPHNVPYSILSGLVFTGDYLEDPYAPETDSLPMATHLARTRIEPVASRGMTCKLGGNQIRFFGERFSVGFSLQRPIITHMGWDMLGSGKAATNLINNRYRLMTSNFPAHPATISGPQWRTLP